MAQIARKELCGVCVCVSERAYSWAVERQWRHAIQTDRHSLRLAYHRIRYGIPACAPSRCVCSSSNCNPSSRCYNIFLLLLWVWVSLSYCIHRRHCSSDIATLFYLDIYVYSDAAHYFYFIKFAAFSLIRIVCVCVGSFVLVSLHEYYNLAIFLLFPVECGKCRSVYILLQPNRNQDTFTN